MITINSKINNWTIIEGPFIKNAKNQFKLKCKCGKTEVFSERYIKRKNFSKNCRSCSQKIRREAYKKYNIGDKLQNLTILSEGKRYNNNYFYKVQCDCGHIYTTGHSTFSRKTRKPYCNKCFNYKENKKPKKFEMLSEDISSSYYKHLVRNADLRGIKFDLTFEDLQNLYNLQNKKCALSNLNIKIVKNFSNKEQRKLHTASLDRINSTKPYIKDNVQWVHKDVNYMKSDFEQNEFINYCNLITKYRSTLSQATDHSVEGAETTGGKMDFLNNQN